MLVATVLALTAAVLHAGWNLVAKRSTEPFVALWGQFLVAGVIGAVVVAGAGGLPMAAWGAAAITGLVHVPYIGGLARAYSRGDFSLTYPVARGGGALVAAIGGIVLLDDDVAALGVVGIVTIVAGLLLLAAGAARAQLGPALLVAAAIGAYTLNDSRAAREFGWRYAFAVFVTIAVAASAYGVVIGRTGALRTALPAAWRQFLLTAVMSVVTYVLVLIAVRRAPVGYVAALRESSVLLAAFLGARYLDERGVRRRAVAATVIVTGIGLLLASS